MSKISELWKYWRKREKRAEPWSGGDLLSITKPETIRGEISKFFHT